MKWLSPSLLIHAYLTKATGRRIFDGPFKDLFFVKPSHEGSYYQKLLGIYGKELHPILERFSMGSFEKVLVIGADEGYYAVGLASNWKRPVLAFESNPVGRDRITRLALINKTMVFVKGAFDTELDNQSNRDFVLMDLLGAEKDILTSDRFTVWANCTIIAKVGTEVTKGLVSERAKFTHEVGFVVAQKRSIKDYSFSPPFKRLLGRWWLQILQPEHGDFIGWLTFEPKS